MVGREQVRGFREAGEASGGRVENESRKEWYDLAGFGEEADGVSSCECV